MNKLIFYNIAQQKFLDFVKEKLEFKEIKLSEYFENSFNFNFEVINI